MDRLRRTLLRGAAWACALPAAPRDRDAELAALLRRVYLPVAREHQLPGIAVGLLLQGRRTYLTHGVTALRGGRGVARETVFEIGSISKCFTATAAGYAEALGALRLDAPVGQVIASLRDTAIGRASLIHLGTYTAGGLPLQFPDEVTTTEQALAYYASFRPRAAPGTIRRYSNPSPALLGHATSRALDREFAALCEREILPALQLPSTFLQVPADVEPRRAWGHDAQQRQIRVNPGVFDLEAYGVKSTVDDMLSFLEAHLAPHRLAPAVRAAIENNLVPRFDAGPFVQGLGWEQYPWPVDRRQLLLGHSPTMVLDEHAVAPASPAQLAPTLFSKTGSTGGFGAYAAFVPSRQVGLVMLANRNFPIAARVGAAHEVLRAIAA